MLIRLGLGHYLHSIDPSRTWREHLEYILIFCETHILRAFQKKFPGHPGKAIIVRMRRAKSLAEFHGYLNEAIRNFPETAHWFKTKLTPWILAAFTKEASRIPIDWWLAAPHHTGICEASHFIDNEAVGRRLTLLSAVLR
jgi:hypothetical protein